MKKAILQVMILAITAVTLTACGSRVEVPPAHVGKLSTASGMQENVIVPSKIVINRFKLPWLQVKDTLVLAEASDYPFEEALTVFMPEDNIKLKVDVRGIASMSADEANINALYDKIPAKETGDWADTKIITMDQTYKTYGEPVIRSAVRTVIAKYTIDEIMADRDAVNKELMKHVMKELSTSPLSISILGLGEVEPPQIVLNAQEARKVREIDIEAAEAEKQIMLKRAEADLEVAMKQQEIDVLEAETQVMVNLLMSEGVNQAFIAQRGLKILEAMAKSTNKVIIVPNEVFSNPALMMGITADAFKDVPVKSTD